MKVRQRCWTGGAESLPADLDRIHTEQKSSESHTHRHADTHMAMFSTDYTIVPNSLASIILPALHWGYCCTCRLLITRWKTGGAAATSTAERRTKKHEAERQRTEKMPRSSQIISGNYRDRPRSRTTVRPRDCTATGASQSHAPRMMVRKSP